MEKKRDRVCVIGAGLCGMSVLFHYAEMKTKNRPEVICYEKHETWGGLWNFTWMIGTDDFGEVCHGSMYKNLWINIPKECFEVSHYTFEEHFGKAAPSFLPRASILNYLQGLWTKKSKMDLKSFIRFNHAVQYVRYKPEFDSFSVSVVDLKTGTVMEERFSHVIVAAGMFSAPNKPNLHGMGDFKGRIIHSKEFREAREFKCQRVLVVGGGPSAEDICMQFLKYGAKSIICSLHTKPLEVKLPKDIETRPPVKHIFQHSVEFEDDSTVDVDAIILCTGYLYRFPFLEECLKLKSKRTVLYPRNLYKGLLWTQGGNNKLFYIGVQFPFFTFPMFNAQAIWIWSFITGQMKGEPQRLEDMKADVQKWLLKHDTVGDLQDALVVQSEYLLELMELIGKEKTPILKMIELFNGHLKARLTDFAAHRDCVYQSVYTGQVATETIPWMENFEETDDMQLEIK